MSGQHDCIIFKAAEELFEHIGKEFTKLLRGVGLAHAAGEESITGE